VGEVDGKQKYEQLLKPGQTVADVVAAEKRREEAIRQAGRWVTRWDWETACNRAALAAHLQRAFSAAAARAA